MALLTFPNLFLGVSVLWSGVVARLWLKTHHYFEVCSALVNDPRPRFVTLLLLVLVGYSCLKYFITFNIGTLGESESSRVNSDVGGMVFDLVVCCAMLSLHDSNVFMAFIPLVGWIILLVLLVGSSNPAGARFDVGAAPGYGPPRGY
jgi:hypothetical protein